MGLLHSSWIDSHKMLLFVFLAIFSVPILAEEWSTISGEHCIDRCAYRGDGNEFHWCYVTDLSQNHLASAVRHGGQIDERFKWDYCIPTSDLDEDSVTAYTSLYPKTKCTSVCKRTSFGPRNVCFTEETDNPDVENHPEQGPWFYCSERIPIVREQISARLGFWCVDTCRKERKGYYWCNTLAGEDFCSPTDGVTYKSEECTSPCMEMEEDGQSVSACYTSTDNSTKDFCGRHDIEIKEVEFTVDNQICGDICFEEGEYKTCHFMEWTFNETNSVASMRKSVNYCGGSNVPSENTWLIILITAISIAAIVALVIGICICRQKRGFRQVPVVGP
eukprot:TRINITY_DN4082_c0_g1_i1.p1 TRINITY_DN4082_c0_g1~~TRINITY_DN4082_c0_g1_i1.p1  ORF type:complete len:333 (-),score=52.64 TRINITY_DN4082_c0_g1_i1:281-1279(-)